MALEKSVSMVVNLVSNMAETVGRTGEESIVWIEGPPAAKGGRKMLL